MTGEEIITLARYHFGEGTALTITEDAALAYLNEAMQELYSDLPVDRMRNLIEEATVSFVSGNRGVIPNTWDRIGFVYVDEKPAVAVPPEVIRNTDYGTFFTPGVPIYHVDVSYLWVRPADAGSVTVLYLNPPVAILTAGLATELTVFNRAFHSALADLTASYMYAQEEDLEQAGFFKNEYMSKISNALEMAAAEAS